MTNHINTVITVLITKLKNVFFQNMYLLGKIWMIVNDTYLGNGIIWV